MPIYTYRREDGTTFDIRQSFADEPLTNDPETGQRVQRIIQGAGIIFKGSGFYVTDNRGASRPTTNAKSDAPAGEKSAPKTETVSAPPAPAAD